MPREPCEITIAECLSAALKQAYSFHEEPVQDTEATDRDAMNFAKALLGADAETLVTFVTELAFAYCNEPGDQGGRLSRFFELNSRLLGELNRE